MLGIRIGVCVGGGSWRRRRNQFEWSRGNRSENCLVLSGGGVCRRRACLDLA